jgi:hypothetical protein
MHTPGLRTACSRGGELGLPHRALALHGVLDGAETWDVVEREPNHLMPAGLVYLIYRIRKANPRSGRFPRRSAAWRSGRQAHDAGARRDRQALRPPSDPGQAHEPRIAELLYMPGPSVNQARRARPHSARPPRGRQPYWHGGIGTEGTSSAARESATREGRDQVLAEIRLVPRDGEGRLEAETSGSSTPSA